jgi:predicted NBD/HSP70 family sugar kinase
MQIGSRAAAGEPAALQAYAALAGYLAEGIANLCNVLDPEAIIISGGLIEGQSEFLGDLQRKVESLLHFGKQRPPEVLRASAGHYAGVQGAAAAVFTGLAG